MKGGICFLGNAASIHTQRWASYFAERDWKVDLITWHRPLKSTGIHESIGIHRVYIPPHYLARYGTLLEIIRLLHKIHPDIIHAHYINTFGILAGLYSRLCGFRPIILTAWGSDVLVDPKKSEMFRRKLQRLAVHQADLITCDAEHMIEVLTRLGAAPEKIELVYFGTDTGKFQPGKKNPELLKKLGLTGSPVVISLRSFTPIYDVESLIKAIPFVLKEVSGVDFVIAGDGPQRSYLENLAGELGVLDYVRFVGWIANEELPVFLNLADIYVSTSLSDAGLAASTAEAISCGLPVIVTDFGDNRKWVEDGVSGFVVPLQNPEALAEKILYLLRDEGKRQEFGRIGRQIIVERNNRDKEMGKMEALYIKTIEKY
ncbi:glycosyltransferase [Chloroflexota bacterium]